MRLTNGYLYHNWDRKRIPISEEAISNFNAAKLAIKKKREDVKKEQKKIESLKRKEQKRQLNEM